MVERASARRRWAIVAVLAAILLVVVAIWVVVAAGSGSAMPTSASPPSSSSAAPGPSVPVAPTSPAAPTAPATPVATPPPPAATAEPPASDAPVAPEAEPVAPDEVAQQGEVEVELVRVEHVDGQAVAPGEISGPAIRITVEVRNGTDQPLDAGLIVVNAAFGPARTPGNSLMQPGGAPFAGAIAPGGSARGVYLFEAGDVELADTLIGVEAVPGSPVFTFRGDLR